MSAASAIGLKDWIVVMQKKVAAAMSRHQ